MSAERHDMSPRTASYAPLYASLHAKQRMWQRNGLVLTPGQWEAIVLQAIEGGLPVHRAPKDGCVVYTVTMRDEAGGFW